MPPDDLRTRAVRAARAAAGAPGAAGRSGVWLTRFDLAWAAAIVVLLACHVLFSIRGRSGGVAGFSGGIAVAEARTGSETRELAREVGVSASVMVSARLPLQADPGSDLRSLLADPDFERL